MGASALGCGRRMDHRLRLHPDLPGGLHSGRGQLAHPTLGVHGLASLPRLGAAEESRPLRADATLPAFYVDGCYLVDPTSGFGILGPDIKRQLTFTLRNPTVDFHRAMRGLMFEYAPGGDITQPVAATFSRASIGTRVDVNVLVATDAISVLRDRHYIGGLRTTLLEGAGTNSCLQSEALDNASWTKGSSTITANTVAAPNGAVTADAVIEV